jgi:hypothetical protein
MRVPSGKLARPEADGAVVLFSDCIMYYGDFSKPTANLTKSSQAEPSRPKEIKRKGLDFLGFSSPDFAFSMGYSDCQR